MDHLLHPIYHLRFLFMSDEERENENQRLREVVAVILKEFVEMGEEELQDKRIRRRYEQILLLQQELDKIAEERQAQPGKSKPKLQK